MIPKPPPDYGQYIFYQMQYEKQPHTKYQYIYKPTDEEVDKIIADFKSEHPMFNGLEVRFQPAVLTIIKPESHVQEGENMGTQSKG